MERDLGHLDEAIALAQSALALTAQTGVRHREAALLNTLADLYRAAGRSEEAMSHLEQAVVIFAEIGTGEQGLPPPMIWMLKEW